MSKNNPINLLMHEHDVIKKLQNGITKLTCLWETDAEKYKKSIKSILHFLKVYSDEYHHQKEERILFPTLEENPSFTLDTILTELHDHHDCFREYAVEIASKTEAGDFAKAQSILDKYLDELLDHIAIENDELFIMTENLFEPGELETMYFRFKDVDRELGEEQKIEFEKFPDEFERSLS